MKDSHGNRVLGRTRWGRFTAVILPALLLVGLMAVLMAQGVLAASFAVSGSSFKVSADRLEGRGFVQYGGVDRKVNGELVPVVISAIRTAELSDLCQSVVQPLPFGGSVTVKITAGQSRPVTAENLVVDLEQLQGNAEFSNIEIGRDASTLDKAPPHRGVAGGFGQQADRIVVEDLRQVAWATTAGTFRLSGLRLELLPRVDECFQG